MWSEILLVPLIMGNCTIEYIALSLEAEGVKEATATAGREAANSWRFLLMFRIVGSRTAIWGLQKNCNRLADRTRIQARLSTNERCGTRNPYFIS